MKLPKTVKINDQVWKIIKDSKMNGGCFGDGEIEIGTKEKRKVLSNFLHEVIEAVLTENFLRYSAPHSPVCNGDYMFVFNHKEFENIIPQIALAIKGIIIKE